MLPNQCFMDLLRCQHNVFLVDWKHTFFPNKFLFDGSGPRLQVLFARKCLPTRLGDNRFRRRYVAAPLIGLSSTIQM